METGSLKGNVDIEILLDCSGSMVTYKDCPGGKSRWDYSRETVSAIATIAADRYDPDGITVVTFSSSYEVHDRVKATFVDAIYSSIYPVGSTNTAAALKSRLDAYFERRKAGKSRRTAFIVITDGEPDSATELIDVIVEAARKVESKGEICISFVQIGQDKVATESLRVLDDELSSAHGVVDIVDTNTLSEVEKMGFDSFLTKSFQD